MIDPVSVKVVIESEVVGLDKWLNKAGVIEEPDLKKMAHVEDDSDRSCWNLQ